MVPGSSINKLLENVMWIFTLVAPVAGWVMLSQNLIHKYVPPVVRQFLSSMFHAYFSSQHKITIKDTLEGGFSNSLFSAADTYITSRIPSSAKSCPEVIRAIVMAFQMFLAKDRTINEQVINCLAMSATLIKSSPLFRMKPKGFSQKSMNLIWLVNCGQFPVLKASTPNREQKTVTLSLEPGEYMVDVFDGVHIKWLFLSHEVVVSKDHIERRSFVLSFNYKHKDMVLGSYFPFILEQSQAIEEQSRAIYLFLNSGNSWMRIKLHHPATFETLAMEPKVKQKLIDDLARFVESKEYYMRIGKAWKRGYLLYGPPGTGKSSLVAAIANHLRFSIYNLDLSTVEDNKSLQTLLLLMRNKSILVVEDIDCMIELQNRTTVENKDGESKKTSVTLSGLLNAVDGIVSCSGQERIIVFTTNYKDRLDSAILRPGRMDEHLYMGYCGVSAFRKLASNYHCVDDSSGHPLFEKIEKLITEVEVTPAEVAELLMRTDDPDIAFEGVIEFLQSKKGGDQKNIDDLLYEFDEQIKDSSTKGESVLDVQGSQSTP